MIFSRKPSSLQEPSTLRVGLLLKDRREELGWNLEDVAKWLKIKESYLHALEYEEIDNLPGSAYVLGFLRTYAEALQLDSAEIVELFRKQHRIEMEHPVLHFPVPESERSIPSTVWVAMGVFVVLGAYIGWYEFGGSGGNSSSQKEAVVEAEGRVAGAEEQHLSPQIASMMPNTPEGDDQPNKMPDLSTHKVSESKNVLSLLTTLGGGKTTDNDKMSPIPPAQGNEVLQEEMDHGTNEEKAEENVAPAENLHPVVIITAKKKLWLNVSDGEKSLFSKMMAAGEKWQVPEEAQQPIMNMGPHGGRLEISVSGIGSGVVEGSGSSTRNIALIPDQLLQKGIVKKTEIPPISSSQVSSSQAQPSSSSNVSTLATEHEDLPQGGDAASSSQGAPSPQDQVPQGQGGVAAKPQGVKNSSRNTGGKQWAGWSGKKEKSSRAVHRRVTADDLNAQQLQNSHAVATSIKKETESEDSDE
ncbi:helix-turn-helix domain-containing protein [Entomobacter blattae]|uniref:Helix-turn-helix domain protein n=1 Tax=Entomobacter blattae TaxID=2762277 RepID=A0A7H1NTM3_9PROT|nr:helix-turn-helix domain-containing protein [Entomobacter blattae]QNT79133.1 Helix-turn-helix domain protein [Entomobacter blattae]